MWKIDGNSFDFTIVTLTPKKGFSLISRCYAAQLDTYVIWKNKTNFLFSF